MDAGAAGAPWWVTLAAGAVSVITTALAAAAGKVWAQQRDEIRQLRHDLEEAHEAHQRDLRRLGGLSTSMDPPPAASRPRPPPVPPRRR